MTDILNEYGLILLEYHSTRNLIVIDKNGYKYKCSLSNLKLGKTPHKFMKNQFAIENLKLYLSIHHPNYELVDEEYLGCKHKMKFICHHHLDKGIQYNTVDNIINGHHICKYCGCSELWENNRITIDIIQAECNRIGVNYIGRFSKNNESHIQYICPYHQEIGIQTTSWTHFKELGKGCPHCNKISKGELKIYNYLLQNNITFFREHKFNNCINNRRLRFDFYLPEKNIIIEFNGIQHYKPISIFGGEEKFKLNQQNDKIKIKYCNDNNIQMIIIPYWDYDNIENILSKYLIKA